MVEPSLFPIFPISFSFLCIYLKKINIFFKKRLPSSTATKKIYILTSTPSAPGVAVGRKADTLHIKMCSLSHMSKLSKDFQVALQKSICDCKGNFETFLKANISSLINCIGAVS